MSARERNERYGEQGGVVADDEYEGGQSAATEHDEGQDDADQSREQDDRASVQLPHGDVFGGIPSRVLDHFVECRAGDRSAAHAELRRIDPHFTGQPMDFHQCFGRVGHAGVGEADRECHGGTGVDEAAVHGHQGLGLGTGGLDLLDQCDQFCGLIAVSLHPRIADLKVVSRQQELFGIKGFFFAVLVLSILFRFRFAVDQFRQSLCVLIARFPFNVGFEEFDVESQVGGGFLSDESLDHLDVATSEFGQSDLERSGADQDAFESSDGFGAFDVILHHLGDQVLRRGDRLDQLRTAATHTVCVGFPDQSVVEPCDPRVGQRARIPRHQHTVFVLEVVLVPAKRSSLRVVFGQPVGDVVFEVDARKRPDGRCGEEDEQQDHPQRIAVSESIAFGKEVSHGSLDSDRSGSGARRTNLSV